MENLQKVLLSITKEEFVILLNSMQLYEISMTYLNTIEKIDDVNCFKDVLFCNMTTKTENEIEIFFFYSEEIILILLNALSLYKKALSLFNIKEYIKSANSLIFKLKNIN